MKTDSADTSPCPTGTVTLVSAGHHPSLDGSRAVFMFPDEDHEGLKLSQEEVRAMSPLYSRLYVELVDAAAEEMRRRLGLPKPAAEVAAREGIVSPVHFYLDRLVRLHRLAQAHAESPLAVLRVFAGVPNDMVEFRAKAQSSLAFNQAVLARHAQTLSLPLQAPAAPLSDPERPKGRKAVNYNNLLGSTIVQRIGRKLAALGWKAVSGLRLSEKRPIPAHALAYLTDSLKTAGFYAGALVNVRNRVTLVNAPAAPALRRAVRDSLLGRAAAVQSFLGALGLSDPVVAAKAAAGLADFLAEVLPTDLLEASPENVRRCSEVLRPFAPAPLLLAETGTPEPTFMMAAAKALGMAVVGVQYGGHHSYMDDHTWANELMYPFFDAFVTWGWDARPDGEACRSTALTPLPSPWLSSRRRFWRKSLAKDFAQDKTYDFLWFTNKIYRFPPAPRGGAICSIDSIREVRAMMTGLVGLASSRGARILHKPYNLDTIGILSKTFSELERLGGASYTCTGHQDKGLTPELVDQCRIVLWDQVGTGILECLAAGIPTMAFWPKDYYNRERENARGLVGELERWGLVHRATDTLFKELSAFKAAPQAWLDDPGRLAAAERFSRAYGWTDDSWPKAWRNYLGMSA
ncbi:MAG: hypothetical protein HY748_17265 [Elusimicrobia bacterium]|nr:hypothetical protein [Elusimicrobiota bacterium]